MEELRKTKDENRGDIEKALAINNGDWKIWEETIQFYTANNKYKEAIEASSKAYKKFDGNYNIGLAHAKALLNVEAFDKVTEVLKNIQVLPYEHASESREIYEQAHIGAALKQFHKKNFAQVMEILKQAKQWPENIGVGKPYNPDERMQDYLLAISYKHTDQGDKESDVLKEIVDYTLNAKEQSNINNLFSLLAFKKLQQKQELDKMIGRLTTSDKMADKIVLAFFMNDITKLVALKANSGISDNLWNMMKTAVEQ